MRIQSVRSATSIRASVLAMGLAFCAAFTANAEIGKVRASTPAVTCGSSAGSSLDVIVTAGATGALGGFTVEWLTLDEFTASGWASSAICSAVFPGTRGGAYALPAGESVTATIGDLLFDNPGATTSCGNAPLACGQTFVFRAFAHGGRELYRSFYSTDIQCTTLPCASASCTWPQGYWKTHGPDPVGDATNVWPVPALTLGSVDYDQAQLQAILDTPAAKGNGLVALAHQLIAAKLNVANGADGSAAAAAIAQADDLIGNLVVPPVGDGTLAPASSSALTQALDDYNTGLTGPGACE